MVSLYHSSKASLPRVELSVLLGDIGDSEKVKKQEKWLSLCGGRGQGCAQPHRRKAVGKEEKRFPPPQNKSATPLPNSKRPGDLAHERSISMWDLEIRLAHAASASLAPPANPDQAPIPGKGSVTHVCLLRILIFKFP